MDLNFTHQDKTETIQPLKLCLSLARQSNSTSSTPLSIFSYWLKRSIRKLSHRIRFSGGFCSRGLHYDGMVVNNSTFCASPGFLAEVLMEKDLKQEECEVFGSSVEEESRESASSCEFLSSETTEHGEQSHSGSEESSSPPSVGWPLHQTAAEKEVEKLHIDDRKLERQSSSVSEPEMMKERFSKLLLGEDMSGCGNGVCAALAISNAITNLCATLFGQLWRLEPLQPERKAMWRREMEWLLCVSNYIVELIPIWQTFPDGSKLEIMTCRPRSDLYVNLPALRKLDHMLLDLLDSFVDSEFWYVDQGILDPEADGSSSFRKVLEHQEDKWWLPIPRVPAKGLSENSRKQLQHKRDCTNQILKAAMAINSITLADMDVPESYLDALPKNGRASLGEAIYKFISSDEFSPVCSLDSLDISSEHQAIEIANRLEAAMHSWRKGTGSKPANNTSRQSSKSSWEMIKELVIDADRSELFAERAESVLLCLKQRFPNLPQTSLDMSKIQYNKDVGKAILESYSRVLESLAFNIVARIEELLYVDDMAKHSDQIPCISQLGIVAHNSNKSIQFSVPFSNSPYRTTFTTPSFSPGKLVGAAKGGARSSMVIGGEVPQRGLAVKRASTDNLGVEANKEECGNLIEKLDSVTGTTQESEETESGKAPESTTCKDGSVNSP